jgi:hypothetical protein
MSYIITAEVNTAEEMNANGDITKVVARVLSKRDGRITFDVPGDFDPDKQKQITKNLCETMIDAGFMSFCIGHSY